MRNLIIALALLVALSVYFSCCGYYPEEVMPQNGFGAKRKGDSGLVVPGNGDQLADAAIATPDHPESERAEAAEVADRSSVAEVASEAITEKTDETNREEQNKVNEMIYAFWYGVMAVLIGNVSALLVAFVWTKIRRSDQPQAEDWLQPIDR